MRKRIGSPWAALNEARNSASSSFSTSSSSTVANLEGSLSQITSDWDVLTQELIHLHEDLETLRAASGLSERQLHKVIQEQGVLQNENETLRCTKEAYESHIHHMEPLLVRERQQASDRDRGYYM